MIHHVVVHVTLLLILAFFVLFAASRAEGFVKLLGMLLGAWLILIAVCAVVLGVTGGKMFGMDMHAMHDDWMHHGWMHHDQPPAPATMPAPAPANASAPAPAPAAAPTKPAGH